MDSVLSLLNVFYSSGPDSASGLYDFFYTNIYYYRWFYIKGAGMTLALSAFAVLFGVFWGLLLAIMRQSRLKIIHYIAVGYIEFIRGTPLIVQVFSIYFGINALLKTLDAGFTLDPFLGGLIAMTINSGAYVAEIFRSGIQAIHRGQTEAALALGFTPKENMRLIIIPQAFKNIIPALVNEMITVVKESSIISVIAVSELMYRTTEIVGNTYTVAPYFITAIIYFIITFILSRAMSRLEKRLRKDDINKKTLKKLRQYDCA